MIFIDRIAEAGEDFLRAIITIREGIPFFEASRGVPAWVGLEYMAQSIAALAGIRARRDGKAIPLGLIIGCRKYTCSTATFAPGTIIESYIKELASEADGLGSFDCTLAAPRIVASARLSVFGGDRNMMR
jgi:predicted hotdog family 3-hydroxylacyl-ACP dehydratase